jgi:hypothetical protein
MIFAKERVGGIGRSRVVEHLVLIMTIDYFGGRTGESTGRRLQNGFEVWL